MVKIFYIVFNFTTLYWCLIALIKDWDCLEADGLDVR